MSRNLHPIKDLLKLAEAAEAIAKADFAANGDYTNAPYTIMDDGIRYKAKIRSDRQGYTCLQIVQPELVIDETSLDSPANLPISTKAKKVPADANPAPQNTAW